jgi:predicted AlkP superfamily phosphohydrolase/phosphomutase
MSYSIHSNFLRLAASAVLIAAAAFGQSSSSRAVLLVSIDGLRPDYVTEADQHGLKIPYLRRLMREGAHAASVRGVLPTSTYPSHATLVTGTTPAKHGIYSNHPFDPSAQNENIWYWYAEDFRVPTLWAAAARAGRVVGSVSWPVSVGAPGIHFNLPEYAGTRTPEDLKMLRALSTPPGLLAELEKKAGRYLIDVNEAIPRDWARTRHAAEMIRQKQARFLTVHLAALDHAQHGNGPFSPPALATLEEIDRMVAVLGDAIRSVDPRSAICVVSDHGFAPVERILKLDAAFVKAGLITLKSQADTLQSAGVADWKAMPWPASGSAAIILKDGNDAATRLRVGQLLESLASDPDHGIAGILDRHEIAKLGGAPTAEFWVDLRPGFAIGSSLQGPIVSAVSTRGTHGHSPAHPELGAFFLIAGDGVRKGVTIGGIDMRSVAPTVARALQVPFPTADLPPLDIFTDPAAAPAGR